MKNKTLGCLLGGAVGDALGYAVEFKNYRDIIRRYGGKGITRYELNREGVAEISDDTQMTLFTAAGCLLGQTRLYMRGIGGGLYEYCPYTYSDWLRTQTSSYQPNEPENVYTWLTRVPQLYARRAPGNTCLQALQMGDRAHNNSCGCGGVMRTSPIALFGMQHSCADYGYIASASAEAARITHKHPLGFIPSAALAYVLCELASSNQSDHRKLAWAFDVARRALPSTPNIHDKEKTFGELWPKEVRIMQNLMKKASELAASTIDDVEAIRQLGEGWTGHEALAIAQYCALKHPSSFEDAIVAAVNHSGDSDSTGSICGNIMGTFLGVDSIPDYYLQDLELRDVIMEIAEDLHDGCCIGDYIPMDTPEKLRWLNLYYFHVWKPKKEMLEECRKDLEHMP